MDIWIGISVMGAVFLGILLFVSYLLFKKRLAKVSNDLHLFKKEKEYASEVIIRFTEDHQIIYANQAAKELFSISADNQIDKNAYRVKLQLDNQNPEDFFTSIQTIMLSNTKDMRIDNAMLIVYGKNKEVNLFIDKSIYNNQHMVTCVIDMDMENNQTHANKQKEIESGYLDFLTNLPSQFTAVSDISSLINESHQKSKSFFVFLLGIDHFTDIQTTLGLSYSNKILKKLSQFFVANQNEKISIYRMEADKFLLLVKVSDDKSSIQTIADDTITAVKNIFRNNKDICLTSSIGVVQYPQDGVNATKLIDNAYIALKRAQEQSESSIEFFSLAHNAIEIDESKINEEIRAGLNHNEFLLHYQPVFDLESERIIGAEALIRWKHPKHGLIAADKFLEVAEKTGLIVDLGEYVFNEAIQQCQKCNTGYKTNFQITINLSLKKMQVDQLIEKLEILFDKYGVPKDIINLDIHESAVMEYIDKTAHDLKLLKEFGLSLSIDNFGAGYSSFKYLTMFPLDMIKIDRSLIFDLALNLENQTTVKAIISFAHTLGYKVVAEGVETIQEATILKRLNCDYAQGYLYSKPLPATEFEEFLNSNV